MILSILMIIMPYATKMSFSQWECHRI